MTSATSAAASSGGDGVDTRAEDRDLDRAAGLLRGGDAFRAWRD